MRGSPAPGIPAANQLSRPSLRHSAITAALNAGVPFRDVQDFAGHADPAPPAAATDQGTTSTGTPPMPSPTGSAGDPSRFFATDLKKQSDLPSGGARPYPLVWADRPLSRAAARHASQGQATPLWAQPDAIVGCCWTPTNNPHLVRGRLHTGYSM